MEENLNPAVSAAPITEMPGLSFMQRLTGVYTEPQKTFEDIGRRGGWLGMFVIMAALAVVMVYILQIRMDHETYMRKALEMSPLTSRLSDEQKQTIISQPQSAYQRYSGMVLAPVGVLVVYLICAAAFLLIFVIMGGTLNFKKSLAVTVWGMAPPGIVGSLLGILFMFLKDPDTLEIDPSLNVVSNLGILVSRKEHPALASLLSSIDIFSFWTIFLLAIGFAAASEKRLTRGKAMTGIVIVWALYVLIKVGFKAIF
jgi:hypothetical protein